MILISGDLRGHFTFPPYSRYCRPDEEEDTPHHPPPQYRPPRPPPHYPTTTARPPYIYTTTPAPARPPYYGRAPAAEHCCDQLVVSSRRPRTLERQREKMGVYRLVSTEAEDTGRAIFKHCENEVRERNKEVNCSHP